MKYNILLCYSLASQRSLSLNLIQLVKFCFFIKRMQICSWNITFFCFFIGITKISLLKLDPIWSNSVFPSKGCKIKAFYGQIPCFLRSCTWNVNVSQNSVISAQYKSQHSLDAFFCECPSIAHSFCQKWKVYWLSTLHLLFHYGRRLVTAAYVGAEFVEIDHIFYNIIP